VLGVDADDLDLGRPLPYDKILLANPGHETGLVRRAKLVEDARERAVTTRQVLLDYLTGGHRIVVGTPEQVARVDGSATGEYLDRVLRGEPLIPLSGLTFADDAGRTPGSRRNVGDGLDVREAIALPIEPPRKRAVSSRS